MSPTARTGAWCEGRRLVGRHRATLLTALLLVLTNRVAALALPVASKFVVDEVMGGHRVELLLPIALLVCAAVVIEAATAFGTVELAGRAGQRAIAELRHDLQSRLIGLPLSHIDAAGSRSLAPRLTADTEQVRFLIGNGSVQLGASAITAILALGLMGWLDPVLTVAVVAILVLLAVDLTRAISRISAAFDRVSQRQAALTGLLGQVLSGARVVKACVAERYETYRFVRESHVVVREGLRAVRWMARLSASSTLATGAVGVLLVVGGSHQVAVGTLTLGTLVMFTWLSSFLLAPVLHITAGAAELGKALGALGRTAELRQTATEAEQDRLCRPFPGVAGAVELEDVSYGYVPSRLALRNVTLRVPAGSTTALVGPSGSGKSTLCRLLLAFDHPTRGRVLIDGEDLATVRRRAYRRHVGVVLQDDVLLEGTIAENIRYGRPHATWADVLAVGRSADCDEFVGRLPDGYATLVGDRGLRLSGGQRQRVAIARAMLADPRILVLDEATSDLDSESELQIQTALHALCRGRTTFVIAHRLSTIRAADQIVVLEAGMVVEQGTHEQLIACEGRYWRLHQYQSRKAELRWGREVRSSPPGAHAMHGDDRCGR